MGGSSTQPTQTTTAVLSPEQREILGLAMPGIREFAASTPQRFQGTGVAGFDPAQTQAQEMALGAAGNQRDIADAARTAAATNLTDFRSVDSPMLQSAITAATRPITENLLESALPTIRGEAVTTGNFGSSRQGVAEGLATGRAAQAVGDTGAKLAQSVYDTNVRGILQTLGLTPTLQAAEVAPAATTGAVGDVRQALEQARINETVGNFNFDQMAPFMASKELAALVAALPGGSTVSTANTPQANPATQALGGAAAGASLGSMLFPGVGTAVGAGAGALLPFLFQ